MPHSWIKRQFLDIKSKFFQLRDRKGPDRVPGPKGDVPKNFRLRHLVSQNFTANATIVFSSQGNFRFRR